MMTNVVHRAICGTEVYEIFGCGKIPAERLSERLRVAIVPLVEQEEFVALAKWHAVTEPSARELVIKLHIFSCFAFRSAIVCDYLLKEPVLLRIIQFKRLNCLSD